MANSDRLHRLIPNGGGHFDVIVAGGGPAGFGAALASSLLGARTLLLEKRGFLGGIASTSLWMPMNRLKLNGGSRGGVHQRLIERLEMFGQDAFREGKTTWTDGDGLHIHPEYLKLSMLELLEDAGTSYRLHSPIIGAQVEKNVLQKAVVATQEDPDYFAADVFVDCTGDGVLSYYAGADVRVGRDGDGAVMPVTLGFALCGADTDRLFAFYNGPVYQKTMQGWIAKAQEQGYMVSSWYSMDRTTLPGVVSVNNGGAIGADGLIDALNAADRTFAQRTGLQIAVDFVRMAHTYQIPGLENSSLMETGADIGVRETRRVICDYVVTMNDAQSTGDVDDVVARRYGAVDQAGLNAMDAQHDVIMRSGYGFPYRGLLVKGIEGLLAAGRCGSYTHLALAAGKSMGNMMAIGQAAGAAAAEACRKGVTPRALPYTDVLEALNRLGAKI